MGFVTRKSKVKLSYLEDKPEVYKLQQLVYPSIRYKELIDYISNSASVPRSTIEASVEAIVQAITYFAINGHRVVSPEFGGFYVKTRSKTAKTFEDARIEKVLKSVRLAYAPTVDLRDLLNGTSVTIKNDGVYQLND